MSDIQLPTVGEIWKEVDPRFDPPRYIRIVRLGVEHALVVAVTLFAKSEWRRSRNQATGRDAPERYAQLKRFNGKRGGYEKVESA